MKLDPFIRVKGLSDEQIHPKFKVLCEYLQLAGERTIVSEWLDGFVDRDNKIIKEFQTTFHSSFWEFFLFALLKEADLEIDQSKDRPDFMVTSPYKINIEAVVANIKKNGKQEEGRTLQDQPNMLNPPHLQEDFYLSLNEAITRYSNAIRGKNKLYHNNYSKCDWVDEETPFVVALGSYDQVNYGGEFIYPMIALLYGWYYNPLTQGYERKAKITKPDSNADIEIGIFNNEEYKNISAIIFSCTVTLGKLTALSISQRKASVNLNKVFTIRHDVEESDFQYKMQIVSEDTPEYLSDGIFIFHNPNAKHKLPLEAFSKTNAVQVTIDNGQVLFNGANLPIVTRFNTPLIPEQYIKSFVVEIMSKYNGI